MFLLVFDGLTVLGGSWLFLRLWLVFVNFGCFLVVEQLLFLVDLDGSRWFFVVLDVFGGFLGFLGGPWWFLMVSGLN